MPRVPAPPTACAVNVFCHGNTSTAQAKEMIEEAAKALGSAPLNLSQLPAPQRLPSLRELRPNQYYYWGTH